MGEVVGAVYVVMCGTDREVVAERGDELAALHTALEHDVVHHCSPWIQYPLEHVHRPDEGGSR